MPIRIIGQLLSLYFNGIVYMALFEQPSFNVALRPRRLTTWFERPASINLKLRSLVYYTITSNLRLSTRVLDTIYL